MLSERLLVYRMNTKIKNKYKDKNVDEDKNLGKNKNIVTDKDQDEEGHEM